MEKDILGKVIEVEKEIQQKLETEKARSEEWVAEVRSETGDKISKAESDLNKSLLKIREETALAAEKKAEQIMKIAEDHVRGLADISDASLKKIILKHIRRILPGE